MGHADDEVTLRECCLANFISRGRIKCPCCEITVPFLGICVMLFLVLGFLGACAATLFIPKFGMCMEASFSDFAVIDSSLNANSKANGLIGETSYSKVKDAATNTNRRRLPGHSRHLSQTFTQADYFYRGVAVTQLQMVYRDRAEGNILTAAKLQKIRGWENIITSAEGYSGRTLLVPDYTTVPATFLPNPPNTIMNYLYAQPGTPPLFNGQGSSFTSNLANTLIFLANEKAFSFFDSTFTPLSRNSTWLVSSFPIARESATESADSVKTWVVNTYIPLLTKLRADPEIEVAFTDSAGRILNRQLFDQFGADLGLAALSLVVIFIIVLLFTRSFFLTIFGMLGIMAAFLPSLVLYRYLFGDYVNIINFVGIWIILGIGADDMFVFLSSYRRAPMLAMDGQLIPERLRLAYAYREAGFAMFVTSFTTSFSFFSLLFNRINPLPKFGVFVGSLVLGNFLLIMTWFPTIITIYVKFNKLLLKCCCPVPPKIWAYVLAVPLAVSTDDKLELDLDRQVSVKAMGRSSRNINKIDLEAGALARQNSAMFVEPKFGSEALVGFVRQATRKLEGLEGDGVADNEDDSQGSIDDRHGIRAAPRKSGELAVEQEFSAFTNLCYAVLRFKHCGLFLILMGLIAIIWFGVQGSKVQTPAEQAKLLPEGTNFATIQEAKTTLDICTTCFGSGGIPNTEAVSSNIQTGTGGLFTPTRFPTTSPTTSGPTTSPATSGPSGTPSINPTGMPSSTPSKSPTQTLSTAVPTTAGPTSGPSSMPSSTPSSPPTTNAPSKFPTTTAPSSNAPTASPSTNAPSRIPTTTAPSGGPSTSKPTDHPTILNQPTMAPGTTAPSKNPTTAAPSKFPSTTAPSQVPTTTAPSGNPTRTPSVSPSTTAPSISPTTTAPTNAPFKPTISPSISPSTTAPSAHPTTPAPSAHPITTAPTRFPSTTTPSLSPVTLAPTAAPVGPPCDATSRVTCTMPDPMFFTDCLSCSLEARNQGNPTDGTCGLRVEFIPASGTGAVWAAAQNNSNIPPWTITKCAELHGGTKVSDRNMTWRFLDGGSGGVIGTGVANWVGTPSPSMSPTFSRPAASSLFSCQLPQSRSVALPTDTITCTITCRVTVGALTKTDFPCPADALKTDYQVVKNLNRYGDNFTESSGGSPATKLATFAIQPPPGDEWIYLQGYVNTGAGWEICTAFRPDGEPDFVDGKGLNITIVNSSDISRATELSTQSAMEVSIVWGVKSANVGDLSCSADGGDPIPVASVTLNPSFAPDLTVLARTCQLLNGLDSVMYRTTDQFKCLGEELATFIGTDGSTWSATDHVANAQIFRRFLEDPAAGEEWTAQIGCSDVNCTQVTWIRQRVLTQISNTWGGSVLQPYFNRWEKVISDINAISEPTTMGKCFQTAGRWVLMEVEIAFVSGFIQSIAYTILLCSITMLMFTGNFALTFLVLAYILSVVICVVGMFETMNAWNAYRLAVGYIPKAVPLWTFGPIEVLAVPTVVGLSIDYALHITHAYNHAHYGDRKNRVKSALENLGISVFCSALTTIFSMAVLAFAVIVIFSTLGKIVAMTTTIGILYSILVIPSMLMYCGPEDDRYSIPWCCPCVKYLPCWKKSEEEFFEDDEIDPRTMRFSQARREASDPEPGAEAAPEGGHTGTGAPAPVYGIAPAYVPPPGGAPPGAQPGYQPGGGVELELAPVHQPPAYGSRPQDRVAPAYQAGNSGVIVGSASERSNAPLVEPGSYGARFSEPAANAGSPYEPPQPKPKNSRVLSEPPIARSANDEPSHSETHEASIDFAQIAADAPPKDEPQMLEEKSMFDIPAMATNDGRDSAIVPAGQLHNVTEQSLPISQLDAMSAPNSGYNSVEISLGDDPAAPDGYDLEESIDLGGMNLEESVDVEMSIEVSQPAPGQ